MKKLILVLVGVLGTIGLSAQQLPQYSQFFMNKMLINPGATGVDNYWEAQATNRMQWVGISEAPRTHVFSAHGPFKDMKMGLGGKVFADVTGPTRRSGFSFSYSYKLQVSKTMKLGMGLSFGGLQYTIDGSQISLQNPDDIAISNQAQSTFVPDAGVGFHLYSDEFYFGVAVPQIIGNSLEFFENYRGTESALARHFFAYTGYKFKVSKDFVIEPAVMAKYVAPAPLSIEGNLRVIYQDYLWLGASYRMDDAVVAMAGITIKKAIIIGYSYDMTTSDLKRATSGSHEVMIGIRFKQKDNISRNNN